MPHKWYSENSTKLDAFLKDRYNTSIERVSRLAQDNTQPRTYLKIGTGDELGLYNLKPGESLPMEIHEDEVQVTHFRGPARVVIGDASLGEEVSVINACSSSQVVIPPGVRHEIQNMATVTIKLWSLYIKVAP